MITTLCFEKKIYKHGMWSYRFLSIYITDDKSSKTTYYNINNHTYYYHIIIM